LKHVWGLLLLASHELYFIYLETFTISSHIIFKPLLVPVCKLLFIICATSLLNRQGLTTNYMMQNNEIICFAFQMLENN